MPEHWVNAGCLHYATVLGDIAKEHCQSAILGVSMLKIADTTLSAVGV